MVDAVIAGKLKRGETFSVDITLRNKNKQLVNLDIALNKVTAEVRREDGSLLVTATVAKTADLGVYTVSYSGSTAAWPLETVYTDIRAEVNGKVVKSKPTTGVAFYRDETAG